MQDPTIGKRTERESDDNSLPQSKAVAIDLRPNPPPAAAQRQPIPVEDTEMLVPPIGTVIAHTFLPPPPRSSSPTIEDCRRRQSIMEQVYRYENEVKATIRPNFNDSYHNHINNEEAKWSLVVAKYPDTKELVQEAAVLGDYDAITIAGYLNIPGYTSRDRIILC